MRSFHVPDRELRLYRGRTLALLRRFFCSSLEIGRLPSLLGREIFRARVTSYRAASFEDAVIFVHDVERTLAALPAFDQQILARLVFQQYTQPEVAHTLGLTERHLRRAFGLALDRTARAFLERRLLTPLFCHELEPVRVTKKSCQEAENVTFHVTASSDTK
jgi:hypothetical protein